MRGGEAACPGRAGSATAHRGVPGEQLFSGKQKEGLGVEEVKNREVSCLPQKLIQYSTALLQGREDKGVEEELRPQGVSSASEATTKPGWTIFSGRLPELIIVEKVKCV